MKKRLFFMVMSLITMTTFGQINPAIVNPLVTDLDKIGQKSFTSLTLVLGNFQFEETGMGSPFARFWEDQLVAALTKTKTFKVSPRDGLKNLPPQLHDTYRDFLGANNAGGTVYGKYFQGKDGVRVDYQVVNLSTSEVVGTGSLEIPTSRIPNQISIKPLDQSRANQMRTETAGLVDESKVFKVKVTTDRGDGAVYKNGENMVLSIWASQTAYLKIYHIDVNGQVQLIFPNQYYNDTKIPGRSVVSIPDSKYPFAFALHEPFGTETIKVVASTLPFKDQEESFSDLGQFNREILTRGLSVRGVGNAKAQMAEGVVQYTIVP